MKCYDCGVELTENNKSERPRNIHTGKRATYSVCVKCGEKWRKKNEFRD